MKITGLDFEQGEKRYSLEPAHEAVRDGRSADVAFLVADAGWNAAIDRLAAGQCTLLGLWADAGGAWLMARGAGALARPVLLASLLTVVAPAAAIMSGVAPLVVSAFGSAPAAIFAAPSASAAAMKSTSNGRRP